MNDTITVRGFVATEPKSSTTSGGTPTASFRLGSTDRRFDRANNVWVDGNTNWFTVQAFRHLAGNIGCSVKKGQRIIVVGKLKLRQWEHDGKFYHVAEIDAEAVGHDLMWGSANFIRMTNGPGPQSLPATTGAGGEENSWSGLRGGDHGSDEDGVDVHDGRPDEDDQPDDAEGGAMLHAGQGDEAVLVDTNTGELVGAGA
ncbi:single-stranded DNA-binding protein [bacterium RCC_150]